MSQIPEIKPGQWISIGENSIKAVVCNVFDSSNAFGERLEVVYLDSRNRAINEDVIWSGEIWRFKNSGPDGGYADRSQRLRRYVGILRNKR